LVSVQAFKALLIVSTVQISRLLYLSLGRLTKSKGVFTDQFPSHRLLEGAAQHLDDAADGPVGDDSALGLAPLGGYGRCLAQHLNIFVCRPGVEILDGQVTNDGVDIVVNEAGVAVIGGNAPLGFPIHGHKVLQKLSNGLLGGRQEGAAVQAILDDSLSFLRILEGAEALPFLPGFTQFVGVVINNGKCIVASDNGCHVRFPPWCYAS